MNGEVDILEVDRIVAEVGGGTASVIPVLQAIQKAFGYLPEAALRRVCEISDITPAQIGGVSSFFSIHFLF
jgi:NADH:ubiquinone oxidoreductase subunit E